MDGQAASSTYHLLKRFSMPHGNGTMDAVAVSHSSGLIIVSLYTLMIKAAITQFWGMLVLIGVALYLKKYPPEKAKEDMVSTTAGLWNARTSPSRVVWLMGERTYRMIKSPWYPLLWMVLGALAVGAALAVPIVKTKQVKIGTVAPVAASAIYAPEVLNNLSATQHRFANARAYSLGVPAALRAAGAIDAVPKDTVFIDNANLPNDAKGGKNLRVNYRYGVTAADFGLQRTPGLALNVTGSCVTDYSWYQGEFYNNQSGIYTDVYWLWNNPHYVANTSNVDGGPPFPFLEPSPKPDQTNNSYGLLISSLYRFSFTEGTDPWYLTESSQSLTYPFDVKGGRPALSCWETAIWSYKNYTSNVWDLDKVPGLRLSDPLLSVFKSTLGANPMLFEVGIKLGRSALASSASALGPAFDASTSSIQNDLSRLVNASYIATRNILAETTRYTSVGNDGIINVVLDGTEVLPGADDFVVSNSADIITLSVRVLIIVPVVLAGVVLLVFILARLPHPWRTTKEFNAIALHKHRGHIGKSRPKPTQRKSSTEGPPEIEKPGITDDAAAV